MFKKRYELKEKDGYVSIVDNRVRVARILLLGLWIVGYIIFLFTARSLGDFAMISLIFVAIVAGTELLLWMLECKYIITDEYIKMQYGFIGPKIWYRDIDRCFHNELFNITLIGNNGKETNIDLLHLDGDVDEYFLEPIRRNGIAVRKIGVFEKSSENGGYKYKFKMQMKGKVGVIIMLASFMLFLDAIFFMLIFDSANDSGMVLLALALFIGNTLLWGFLMYNYTAVFEIDNGKIAFHKCFGKAKELDVKQISWVNSEIVQQSNNGVNQDVETLNIYVKGKELGWKNKPSRNYTNYDMLVAFLQDSNVPFSLEKEELLTYSKLEEDAEKTIPELLNLDEHAFTVDKDFIIENGIFKGKRFFEEDDEKRDYSAYIKKIKPLNTIETILLGSPGLCFIVTVILAKADVLSYITAILIPIALFVAGLVLSQIEGMLSFREIKTGAKLYKATVFKADVLAKEKYVLYAYEDEDGVRLIEPLSFDSKMKQDDWKARYGRPTSIWANLDKLPYCIEEEINKEEKSKKEALKLVGFIVGLVILVALAYFAQVFNIW